MLVSTLMRRLHHGLFTMVCFCLIAFAFLAHAQDTHHVLSRTNDLKALLRGAKKTERGGWQIVSIAGAPYQRGFQYGYLSAQDFKKAYATVSQMTYLETGVKFSRFIDVSYRLSNAKIPAEYRKEMQGYADGASAAGVPTTFKQILAWNNWMEIVGYWWPSIGSKHAAHYVQSGLISNVPGFSLPPKKRSAKHIKPSLPPINMTGRCSAFIATGAATGAHRVVIGHETFADYWLAQYFNYFVDLKPDQGHELFFQTMPGLIQSESDFVLTDAGLLLTETTNAGDIHYDVNGKPEFIRAREASQYANSITDWVRRFSADGNGAYSSTWLIGNSHNHKIAQYVDDLNYQDLTVLKDGSFAGYNAVVDPRVRLIDSDYSGYDDTRQSTGARRVRFAHLLQHDAGHINLKIGEAIIADTYDPYLKLKHHPSSRTICGAFDRDPQPYVSVPQGLWNIPFYPGGSVDGIVATLAKDGKHFILEARWGRANGQAFNASQFIEAHPQWAWQKAFLESRPEEPWVRIKVFSRHKS